MNSRMMEYIWIGGKGELRSKTKIVKAGGDAPVWSFDGSSTGQAKADMSDLMLRPVVTATDPIRGGSARLAFCEVLDADGNPHKTNARARAKALELKYLNEEPLFGIEQEYTLTIGRQNKPLGLVQGGYAHVGDTPKQGQFYCAVGANNVFGRKIAEEHMEACLKMSMVGGHYSMLFCGINAEVMPGQWEFQIGPGTATDVSDRLWIARYLLIKIAEKYNIGVSFKSKPHPELNGAGAHTNYSTAKMRESLEEIFYMAAKLGSGCTEEPVTIRDTKFRVREFPKDYGTGWVKRLTGDCETCRWDEFKFGVGDRTASVRIPLHVEKASKGYLEDRRPNANADPYNVTSYIMEKTLGE